MTIVSEKVYWPGRNYLVTVLTMGTAFGLLCLQWLGKSQHPIFEQFYPSKP
jgi:hypothetical protein